MPLDSAIWTADLCPAREGGARCCLPVGHEGPLHRDKDGRIWYYSDGERQAELHRTMLDIAGAAMSRIGAIGP